MTPLLVLVRSVHSAWKLGNRQQLLRVAICSAGTASLNGVPPRSRHISDSRIVSVDFSVLSSMPNTSEYVTNLVLWYQKPIKFFLAYYLFSFHFDAVSLATGRISSWQQMCCSYLRGSILEDPAKLEVTADKD